MKGQKQKQKAQQNLHNHPTIFSISIFESPQEFIALYLALESQNDQHKIYAGKYLQGLLHRTKSPPIALTYTKQFTLLRSESQIQLTIIRFISQLSDLSAGKSMQSSLSFIIENSSFLTELRHNLTHRVMVKGLVIERGKEMILSELKEKYWKIMFEKVWKTYFIDKEKVDKIFGKIISKNMCEQINEQKIRYSIQKSNLYRQYVGELESQELNKLSFNYLFKHCQSNYEFKSLLKGYIVKKMLPQLRLRFMDESQIECMNSLESKVINKDIMNEYLSLSSLAENNHFNIRSIILFSTLLDLLLSLHKYEQLSNLSQTRQLLSQIFIILINQLQSLNFNTKQSNNNKSVNPLQSLLSPVVIKKLRQLYLIKYIEEYNILIESLPEEIVSEIKKYWQQKEIQMGKQLIIDF